MSAKLSFNLDEIRPLVEHAKAAPQHGMTYEMQFDSKHWLPGVKIGPGEWPKPEQLDYSSVKPHLQLVKDHGVYIMSSGRPILPGKDTLNHVVYAKGLGPDADYDAIHAVSGDDLVVALDLDFFEKALAMKAKSVDIKLNARSLSMTMVGAQVSEAAVRIRPQVGRAELGAALSFAGSSTRPKWAGQDRSYKGVICGYDTYVVFQKAGRGIVIHEKALLPSIPTRGASFEITYPEGPEWGVATVVPSLAKSKSAGLAR